MSTARTRLSMVILFHASATTPDDTARAVSRTGLRMTGLTKNESADALVRAFFPFRTTEQISVSVPVLISLFITVRPYAPPVAATATLS